MNEPVKSSLEPRLTQHNHTIRAVLEEKLGQHREWLRKAEQERSTYQFRLNAIALDIADTRAAIATIEAELRSRPL